MSLKIVVLAKQVPDTRNVGKDAMKADGTINRAALPAIFNPEDLNALEQALRLKDEHPGSTVTILTMGPGRAAEVIREGLYRGADNGYLLTDRAFAGADTLATSYALATAIKKIGASANKTDCFIKTPTIHTPCLSPCCPRGESTSARTAVCWGSISAEPSHGITFLPKNTSLTSLPVWK